MKVLLVLADSAVVHTDNTTSALRMGIDSIAAPAGQPIIFASSLIAFMEPAQDDLGEHSVKIRWLKENYEPLSGATEYNGLMKVTGVHGRLNLVVNLGVQFPGPGVYFVEFAMGSFVERLRVTVKEQQQ